MFKLLSTFLAGSLLIISCGRTHIVTDHVGEGGPDTSYFCGSEAGLSWKRTTLPGEGSNEKQRLPKAFNSFLVVNAALFFERAKGEQQEVLIPLPAGCIPFKATSSGTMSGDLQKKYPQLVSLKGSNGAGDDLRLDWDGTTFTGQVLTAAGGKTYFIKPAPGGAANTYLVYDKADSRDEKQPFENPRITPPSSMPQRMTSPQADK